MKPLGIMRLQDNYIYRKMFMLLVRFKNYKTKYIINLFVISKSKR